MVSVSNLREVERKANEVVSEWLNVSNDLKEEIADDNVEFVVAILGLMEIVNPEAYKRYSKLLDEMAASVPKQ